MIYIRSSNWLVRLFHSFSWEEGDLPKMARASTLAENLEKELECAVCLEQFKDPKVLPCLHSFCKICLEGLVCREGKAWKLNCPSCRIIVEVSLWMWCTVLNSRDVKSLSVQPHLYRVFVELYAHVRIGVMKGWIWIYAARVFFEDWRICETKIKL